MSRTKYLKGECLHCGGRLEFPAEAIGTTVDCPHCGQSTELQLEPIKEQSTVPRRGIIYAGLAAIILVLGLIGALIALKRAERMVSRNNQQHRAAAAPSTNAPADAAMQAAKIAGFDVSPISLEKTKGSSLVYAVGTLRNLADKQRFGVKIELDVLDGAGGRITTAKDYQQVMEPNGQWQFRALVTDSKAAAARLASIREDQ